MDGKTMITVSHKPEGSAENFRETTNLFVFNRNLVAIRDSVDKRCYIQHTDATYAEMKAMVNGDAQDTNGDVTGDEERIDVSSLTCKPFTPFAVKLLFGDEIESFCRFHDVYFLDDSNVQVVGKEVAPIGDGAANLRLRRDLEITVTVSIGPIRIKVTVRI
ncbi:uncharacterized protein LOC124291865 [Haliotis rubra]|uniref:uncharacterized protein LOC124291865 n=1 Tax=Haliotis rubra TaxID=36100 RepID=UPI001EE58E6A|nr:uncharacterized protein LOC124291865 [Haliotis rubra]